MFDYGALTMRLFKSHMKVAMHKTHNIQFDLTVSCIKCSYETKR